MRTVKLAKINPVSCFKVGMGIGAVIGIIAAVVYMLVAIAGGLTQTGILAGIGAGFLGILTGVLLGAAYMFAVGISCWLCAVIYNIIAKYTGGLEVDITGL